MAISGKAGLGAEFGVWATWETHGVVSDVAEGKESRSATR